MTDFSPARADGRPQLPLTPPLQSPAQDLGFKWKHGCQHICEGGQSCSKANVEFELYRSMKFLENITSFLKLLQAAVQCCMKFQFSIESVVWSISSVSITWELIRNAKPWNPPHLQTSWYSGAAQQSVVEQVSRCFFWPLFEVIGLGVSRAPVQAPLLLPLAVFWPKGPSLCLQSCIFSTFTVWTQLLGEWFIFSSWETHLFMPTGGGRI